MLIELTLHRAGGSHVSFPETETTPERHYHYKPDDQNPRRHVCDVDVPEHIQRLLTIEGYKIPGDAKQTVVKPSVIPPPPEPTRENLAPGEDTENVNALRELSVRDLKASINTYTEDELRAALALEEAQEKPRGSWVDVVKAHLG